MILSSLNNLLKLLGGEPAPASPEEQRTIVNEAMLLVLSRATESDANIKPIEVDAVCAIIKKATGEDVSAADVRVAAHSKIYETASLESHLADVARLVGIKDRAAIAHALAEVILSDERVTTKEVRFFNSVCEALDPTPAALCGLHAED